MSLFDDIFKQIDAGSIVVGEESEVSELLRSKVPPDHTLTDCEAADLVAFSLGEYTPASTASWGGFFGPRVAWVNSDETVGEMPRREEMKKEWVECWRKRINEVEHPILKSRYFGLVWDLPKALWSEGPDHALRAPYIESSLQAVENGKYKRPTVGIMKIRRIVDIASKFNDEKFFDRIVSLILSTEQSCTEDDKPGLWLFAYDILSSNKKIKPTAEQMDALIQRLETRLENLKNRDGKNGKLQPWAAEDAAKCLAEYYVKKGDKESVRRVILKVGEAFEHIFPVSAGIQVYGWLEHLYRLYSGFHLHDDAEQMIKRMREMGDKVTDGMTTMGAAVEIPEDAVNKLVDELLAGTPDEVFLKIGGYYIPSRAHAVTQLEQLAQVAPFQHWFSKAIAGEKGRTKAVIGPVKDDLEGNLAMRISESMQFMLVFLHHTIQAGADRGIISFDTVKAFLSNSAIMDENRSTLVERALCAYFENDYMVFIHLIIPQIEQSVRNMLEIVGGNVMRYKDGAFNLRTFDDVLGDEKITEFWGEDAQTYYRVLFTDRRGINVRNDALHGLLPGDFFGRGIADWIFHSLLLLGMVRKAAE